MSLYKYFEKRAKDGPLSSRHSVSSDKYPRACGVSAESVAPEGKKCGPYNK